MGKLLKRIKARKAKKRCSSKKSPFQKTLANSIRNLKGKPFSWSFMCDLCKVTHTHGYIYNINNEEYSICKFCNDRIHHKENYVRIIYTPMGNNQ